MIARPKAISNNTQKTDRPLKPCIAKMAPNSDKFMMTPVDTNEILKPAAQRSLSDLRTAVATQLITQLRLTLFCERRLLAGY
jgi:hypothetical protein